ncbi:Yip1 family protein [Methanoculleus oceani]|uniref:YIP1 family protein n=1 Tax=Methanoculleus oceani TaxID=2184756 RepID=A0ABD4TAX1_9EURY|nr:Yip1 family protein [Methanoculleus sp. CWC-02]MCM2465150.1 YIP1 family protein [Methanoculleus sp. CWC-02]
METGFLRVLLNPGRFFEARMQDEPSLKIPALIALVIGLIGVVSAVLMANITIAMLPDEMQGLGVLITIFSAAIAFIGGLLVWVIYGFVFYLVSMVFKGSGDLKRTLEFTGYGLLPQVFGGIIGTFFTYQLLSGLTVPPMTSPEQIAEFSESLVSILTTDPLAQIAGLVSILFMIWSANIWVFGMKYARNLSTRDAVLTVGIPIGLYILYTLITLAGWL